MARCGLIALDLDGTALTPAHILAPETCRAIQKARSQGVRVVIATGRSSQEAAWFAQEGGFDRLAAALGGAVVVDCETGKQLHRWDLLWNGGREVLKLCLERRLDPMIFAGEQIFLPDWSVEALAHYFPQKIWERDVQLLDAPLSWLAGYEGPLTKLHVEGDPARFPKKEAASLPGMELTSSGPGDFEVLPENIDKGKALALLAERYGIPLERCAAVGDSENDVGMLRAAGIAVAMGNASPAAVEAAQLQVADNVHHGAAQAIEWVLERM